MEMRPSYGRAGPPDPAPHSRTGRATLPMQTSGRIRLLSNRAIVIGTTGGDYSPRWLGQCTFRSRYSCIRLSVRLHVCHKAQPLPVPRPSRLPAPRQPISGVTRSIGFLGHPTPTWLAAWLPAPARGGESTRRVSPFRVSI
jgi:hypothetical protein